MNGQPQGNIFFHKIIRKVLVKAMQDKKSTFNIELISGVGGEETPVRIIVCV